MRNAIRTLSSCSLALAAGLLTPSMASAQMDVSLEDIAYGDVKTIKLDGVVRDFRAFNVSMGHPDFERVPENGQGVYCNLVEEELDEEGKPVYTGAGVKIESSFKNSKGDPIAPQLFDPALGDIAGLFGASDNARIESQQSFRQWYRDAPNVNSSARFTLELDYDESRGTYVFDGPMDTQFMAIYGGNNKNRDLTFEVESWMAYAKGAGDVMTFSGNDDVWVFIDGRLVVDLGGIHPTRTQTVELDRLDWLQDGGLYTVKIFYANRFKNTSHLRVETSIHLRTGKLPSTMAQYD